MSRADSAAATRSTTGAQSPGTRWRMSRTESYHGCVSSLPQHQCDTRSIIAQCVDERGRIVKMLLIVGKRKDVRAGRAHRRDIAFAARSNRIERDIRQAPRWREGIHGNAALDI